MMENTAFKTNDGVEYFADIYGVIHQLNPQVYKYDGAYVDTYRKPEYREQSALLMGLRLGCVLTAYKTHFKKDVGHLLDYGFGDGSFLNAAKKIIPNCTGVDVTNEKVPEGCEQISIDDARQLPFDVVTFWDVFEHIHDIDFIENLNAHMVVISLPNVENRNFETWKHRKPNEHLHHFTPESLRLFMDDHGWKMLMFNHQEDVVRVGMKNNILTGVFVKW